jgi:hypothetical protein
MKALQSVEIFFFLRFGFIFGAMGFPFARSGCATNSVYQWCTLMAKMEFT